jgi:hypothetical protein
MKEGEDMQGIARRAVTTLEVFALPALTLIACVQRPALVIETATGDIVRLESWTATLTSSQGLHGTATLAPLTYRETLATLSVTGAPPDAIHVWYVQLGECGRDLGILAGPQAYTPVTADAQGEGRSTVVLPFTVPTSGRYFVTVRGGDRERSPVVACGNLTKDTPAGGPTIAEARAP